MKRTGLALLLIAVAGAAPTPTPSLPVPPIPPEHPPMDQSAPVPNPDLRGPQDTSGDGTRLTFTDFRLDRDKQSSLGYSPGSQFQNGEDRRVIQTPGLTVRVPLQ
jgi:hypothetical protein